MLFDISFDTKLRMVKNADELVHGVSKMILMRKDRKCKPYEL